MPTTTKTTASSVKVSSDKPGTPATKKSAPKKAAVKPVAPAAASSPAPTAPSAAAAPKARPKLLFGKDASVPIPDPVETAYQAAMELILSHTDYERMRVVRYNTSTFSLDRMKILLGHLGHPETRFKSAHIAGTKGKGSTSHMLAAMLCGGGLKVGLYTSPHLVDIRERIAVNGQMISRETLIALVEKLAPVLKKMTADKPTFFEIFTAMAFVHFADEGVDMAVIETGLGGRLDSTNVITPEVTGITSISKDHMAVLGNTLAKIAEEKAGIFKKDVPALSVQQDPEVIATLERVAKNEKTPLQIVGRDIEFSFRFEVTRPIGPHMRVCLSTERSRYEHLTVPLMGEHQAVNCGLALAMLDQLKARGIQFDEVKALEGLANLKLSGRLEMVCYDPRVIIDGAHNAASMQALFRGIGQHITYDSMVVIFGCNCDKDVDGMLEQLSLGADKVIFTRASNNPKSSVPEELAALYTERFGKMAQVASNLSQAIDVAERAISREDLITITGSFYVIGEAKEYFAARDAARKARPPAGR